MSGHIVYEANPHQCWPEGASWGPGHDLKASWVTKPGTIWQCDECGSYWHVVRHLWDKWEPMTRWQVKRARRRGLLAEPGA